MAAVTGFGSSFVGRGGGGIGVGVPPPAPTGSRRRKPQPERLAPLSPLMKSLIPGGGRGGGGGGGGALLGGTPTQGSAMAAVASAALSSPGLLVSPGFLQGMNAAAAAAAAADLPGREESVLRHCLSSQRARRWCAFEFHCSALDRPWFLRNELAELLQLLLGPSVGGVAGSHGVGAAVVRLTRAEWALLRSAFGRPRRFSAQFLKVRGAAVWGLKVWAEHVGRPWEAVRAAQGAWECEGRWQGKVRVRGNVEGAGRARRGCPAARLHESLLSFFCFSFCFSLSLVSSFGLRRAAGAHARSVTCHAVGSFQVRAMQPTLRPLCSSIKAVPVRLSLHSARPPARPSQAHDPGKKRV
eukprot:111405-Chlamydomonas_euryale.AAC.3